MKTKEQKSAGGCRAEGNRTALWACFALGALLFCLCASLLLGGALKPLTLSLNENDALKKGAQTLSQEGAEKRYKVGWLSDDATCFYNKESGEFSGYNYDVLFELSQYADFGLEFVLPESKNAAAAAAELKGKLISGEIDILCNAYEEEAGLFYTSPYGESYYAIALPAGSTLSAADLNKFKLTVAVVAGDEDKLRFAEQQLGEYTALTVSSRAEQYAALNKPSGADGHADAVLITDFEKARGVKRVLKFAPRSLRFVSADKTAAAAADAALDKMTAARPAFLDGLKDKYFSAATPPELTDEERKFIAERGTLRVVLPQNKAPISYYSEDGAPIGIAKDVMNYVAAKTGMSVTYVRSGDLEAALKENQADIIAAVPRAQASAESYAAALSGEYLTSGLAVIANKKVNPQNLKGKRLILAKGMPVSSDVENRTFADSLAACLKLVNEGKADYTYGNTYCISYLFANEQYKNLSFIGLADAVQSIAIGVSRRESPLLLSAVNKALSSMTDAEKNDIIFSNCLIKKQSGFNFFHSPLFALTVALIAAGALFLVIEMFVHKLRRRDAVIDNRWKRLCELDNQYLYYYDLKRDVLSLSPRLAEGFSRPQSLKRFSKLAQSEGDADFKRIVKSFRDGKGGVAELKIKGDDGSTRYLLISEKEIEDGKGRAVGALGKVEDITDEKEYNLNKSLGKERDSLTDLYNSAAMKEKVEKAIKEGVDGAVFMLLDIDNFTRINEYGGNLEGDKVLIAAARVLENTLKDEDALIGRLGGDEFIVYIQSGINRRRLTEIVSALRYNIRSITVSVKGMSVTLSLGCVMPKTGQSFNELYDRADKALHEAKAAGRNTYEIARGIDE